MSSSRDAITLTACLPRRYAPFALGALVLSIGSQPILAGLSLSLAITLQPIALLLLPALAATAGWLALAYCILLSALSVCLSTLCEASVDWVTTEVERVLRVTL